MVNLLEETGAEYPENLVHTAADLEAEFFLFHSVVPM